ncbi:MAG: hypothetical protein CVV37_07005 [Nitrospira bacterium HGW-Nitrospira-1]|nr:MAG: hypothetical protein CVV37_07005 [Nitrospira bacterium HGW-Nitrospira-1]
MDEIIRKGIIDILKNNMTLLRIPIRQKAKFEGWLKFELAHYLEQSGMQNIEVETKTAYRRDRTDITFVNNGEPYYIELKTPNTNWKLEGVNNNCRPITKNIQSVIDDAKKLNSNNGIVAFVLFPVPVGDNRWKFYLDRINEKTDLGLSREKNCELIDINIDEKNACSLIVCAFMSKRFSSWP